MNFYIGEIVSIIIFFIAFYGLMARRNILKTVISLTLLETAAIIFFISILNKPAEYMPPIGSNSDISIMADPLPQALMITAIVIGISVTAVNLTLFISLYHKYQTTNWDKVKYQQIKEREND